MTRFYGCGWTVLDKEQYQVTSTIWPLTWVWINPGAGSSIPATSTPNFLRLWPGTLPGSGDPEETNWTHEGDRLSTRVAQIPLRAVVHIDWRLLRGNAAIDLEGVGDVTLVRGVDGENPLWFRVETPDRSQHTVFVDEFEPAITAVDLPATEVPDGNGSDE
jgi:hypothetical protein